MIRILIGPKGTGKTKTFINMVNDALDTEKGNVVCLSKGSRHTFDIASDIRLVDTEDFDIKSAEEFYGLVSGIISQNFDITHIFIDSITKIAPISIEDFNVIFPRIENLANKFSVKFTIAISADKDAASDDMKKFVVNI